MEFGRDGFRGCPVEGYAGSGLVEFIDDVGMVVDGAYIQGDLGGFVEEVVGEVFGDAEVPPVLV